jgi:hypothetical protein
LAILFLPPGASDATATLLPPLVTAAMLIAANRVLGTTPQQRPSGEPIRPRLGVVILIAAVAVTSAFGIARLRWQHGPRRVVPPQHHVVADWGFIDRHFNGLRLDYVRIPVQRSFTWQEHDRLEHLQERLRGVDGIRHVTGIHNLLRAFIVPGSRLLPAEGLAANLRRLMPDTAAHLRGPLPAEADASPSPAPIWSRLLVFYESDADIGAVLEAHQQAAEICRAEVPDSHVAGLAVYECKQLLVARRAVWVALAGWVLLTAAVCRPWSRGLRGWLFATLPVLVYFGGLGGWDGLLTNDRAATGIWIGTVGFLLGRQKSTRIGLIVLSIFPACLVPVLLPGATVVEPIFGFLALVAAYSIVELFDSGG